MANNRMLLRCKMCGQHYGLAKRMGSGYYTYGWTPEKGEAFNQWLELHEFGLCNLDYKGEKQDQFELEYEHPPGSM